MTGRHFSHVLMILIIIFFSITGVSGKSLHSRDITRHSSVRGRLSTSDIRALEGRLTRFFRNRLNPPKNKDKETISESDFLQLHKVWNELSDEFLALYKKATAIPDSFDVYLSPGGHFSVYYTTKGWNAVDPTDEYHFSSEDWRTKVDEPNGIPDYVDETAFGFDSSWAMEVERFGFIEPVVYKFPADSSERYKVSLEALDDSFYGFTHLQDPAPGKNKGFASRISVRNDWSGSEWTDLGYDKHPLNALHVTCAHEFFHAVQYAMSWNVRWNTNLDDFPIGWIEGSATAMEEFAFPSINDYHQYSQSYFVDTDMSFFGESNLYSNSLLILYLYKHAVPGGGIDFIYNMHFNNYDSAQSFDENLYLTAEQSGTTWGELLHRFHVASYYTGDRADTGKFIDDAADFTLWEPGESKAADTQFVQMSPNSAKSFKLIQDTYHIDTVSMHLAVLNDDFENTPEKINASVLLRTTTSDTVLPFSFDSSTGTGSFTYAQWKQWDDMIIIVTNSNPDDRKIISFFMQPYGVTFTEDETVLLQAFDSTSNAAGMLQIHALKDLRINPDYPFITVEPLTTDDTTASFYPVTGRFTVSLPSFFFEDAQLSFNLTRNNGRNLPSDTIFLGYRRSNESTWDTIGYTTAASTSPSIYFSRDITESGEYLFLCKNEHSQVLPENPLVFPNPFSIKKHRDFITFRGRDIAGIYVYTFTGSLIWNIRDDNFSEYASGTVRTYNWNGKSRSGRRIAPGTYPVMIVQDNGMDSKKHSRYKLVVTP